MLKIVRNKLNLIEKGIYFMKKMYVIRFKELKSFSLIFDEVSIHRFADSSKISYIALRDHGELICTVDLNTTKLVHKNTTKIINEIIVEFYLEDVN